MILKLEHTTTHQTYEYEVSDMNNGEKLYFRFDINTLNLDEGEYNLSLYDEGNVVCSDILKIGDYNPNSLQYRKGENTYINVTLENTIQGDKKVNINSINTTIKPDSGYTTMSSVEVNAQELFDEAFEEGNKIGFQDGKTIGEEIGYINGKEDGRNVGIEEQKAKLEPITITENGVYQREDGYSEVTVNVPDTNGSFDDGFGAGYQQGYDEGLNEGTTNAGEIIGETARVLDITENGTYYSRYSDVPEHKPLNVVKDGEYTYIEDTGEITGYFDDGTPFYGCGTLDGLVYKTEIRPNENTRLEFWYKGDGVSVGDGYNVIIAASTGDDKDLYQIRYSAKNVLQIAIGGSVKYVSIVDNVWTHILIEDKKIYINGVFKDELTPNKLITNTFYINGASYTKDRNANGSFGIIKIDDVILLPTPIGIVQPKEYDLSGNLIKTVNVNIQPKVNVAESGVKLAFSTFSKIPDYFDFKGLIDGSYLFYQCQQLTTIPELDTSLVTNMNNMFRFCNKLTTIPLIDTSNVTNMEGMFSDCKNLVSIPKLNTSNVTNMQDIFSGCDKLTTIPQLDTSNVTNMRGIFNGCGQLQSVPPLNAQKLNIPTTYQGLFMYNELKNLTDFGGLVGLKYSLIGEYNFTKTPNLSYQSCINILNGLYDFTGNGETPASNQGQLRVHQNFINTVGDEISIGVGRGWSIFV